MRIDIGIFVHIDLLVSVKNKRQRPMMKMTLKKLFWGIFHKERAVKGEKKNYESILDNSNCM